MKNFLIAACFCLLLTSCGIVTYLGDKYPPTTSVDVFYSAHDVKKDYKVIGHMNYPNIGQDQVKAKFIAYARSIGADAIVITGTAATSDSQAAVVNADALKYN